jgi:rfaE bifunctional protein nucleotidyltransferase chain/domain
METKTADTVYTRAGQRSLTWLCQELSRGRDTGLRVVTTNGCFDWLHPGHVEFLSLARAQGDCLVVLLNSDASVREVKGPDRPLIGQDDRAAVLLGLRAVDYVVLMNDLLPNRLLDEIRPNVHCKGGDYTPERMPEMPIVEARGGEVRILPLVTGYSTSELIERMVSQMQTAGDTSIVLHGNQPQEVIRALLAGSNVLRQTAYLLRDRLVQIADWMCHAIRSGNKILVCGNSGSVVDAEYFAAQLINRYPVERPGWPAIALTVDPSSPTSSSDDDRYERVFARQVEALGRPGDLLLAISTNGCTRNVALAIDTAAQHGLRAILLTGSQQLSEGVRADSVLPVPSEDSSLVRQAHIAILHILYELIEQGLVV